MPAVFATVVTISIVSSVSVWLFKAELNLFLMRFFRDVSRFKARKRLYGNEASLVALLTKQQKPLVPDYGKPEDESDGFTMTPSELAQMNGQTPDTPIYIAVKGHIYDVSSAAEMYGPTANYRLLVARDATLPFSAGCCEENCIGKYSQIWYSGRPIEGLSTEEIEEIDTWVELYHTHDRYTYVGELVPDTIEELISQDQQEEAAN
jgi:hypothetical protein